MSEYVTQFLTEGAGNVTLTRWKYSQTHPNTQLHNIQRAHAHVITKGKMSTTKQYNHMFLDRKMGLNPAKLKNKNQRCTFFTTP